MQSKLRHALACAWLVGVSCGDTIAGQQPVGGSVDTEAEIQRFLRRAYLDLTGSAPTDDELAAATTRLEEQSNTPTARGALVDELIGRPALATVWVEELENSIFGGNTLDSQYALVCGIIRGDASCQSCTATDSCACDCPPMAGYASEREALRTSATDFAAGTTSAAIERRYAMATGYYALAGSAEGRVSTLFDDFLSRPAEADELENGRSMIFGAIIPGSPAGLLFHRHGASYADLVDIVFDSEIYREAAVRRVFERYLARAPSAVELEHFVSTLDANDPDVRSVIRAVVSSREYFEQ
ncbi:MAG TPA: DUF1549 domain-containing protein [Kofleriaceae bacterium]|nr:DUF1549 domain-containing protein [Kofleriaceae bacterium]